MRTLAERLFWARAQKSLREGMDFTQSDLASKASVSQGAIGHLESGRTSTSRSIIAIAKALDVDPVWLAEGKGSPFADSHPTLPAESFPVAVVDADDPDFYHIPKVELQLRAGVTGFQTMPEIFDGSTLALQKNWVHRHEFHPSKLFAITVKGDSMEPNLYSGDLVIVNTGDLSMVDGAVYAFNYEGEAVIKRLSRDAGQWWLTSDNPDQRKYHRKSCRSGECIIVGRVVKRETEHI